MTNTEIAKMSCSRRAWVVAASVGVVEALKDQGICRWNHTIRSVQQYAKNHVRSVSQAKKLSTPSAAAVSDKNGSNRRNLWELSCTWAAGAPITDPHPLWVWLVLVLVLVLYIFTPIQINGTAFITSWKICWWSVLINFRDYRSHDHLSFIE